MNMSAITFPMFGENFVINPPPYFTIFGFQIFFYGVLYMPAFALAGLYIYKRRKHFELSQDNVLDMVILAVIGGLIGARIYYILFNPALFFGPGNWGNLLQFRVRGLAIYGGVIGAGAAYLIFCRVKNINYLKFFDAGAFGLFIGQSIGRWGNFINREAFGVETAMPWRMGLETATDTMYVHPTFLYESLWNMTGLLLLHIFSKKRGRKYYGQYFLFYVAWYGLGRFFIEGLRTDSLFIPGTALRVSQVVAIVTFIPAVGLLIYNHIRKTENALKPTTDAEEILKEYSKNIDKKIEMAVAREENRKNASEDNKPENNKPENNKQEDNKPEDNKPNYDSPGDDNSKKSEEKTERNA